MLLVYTGTGNFFFLFFNVDKKLSEPESLITFIPWFRCPNLAVKEAEDDEIVEEEDVPVEKPKKVSHPKRKKQTQCKLSWIGETVQVFNSPAWLFQ